MSTSRETEQKAIVAQLRSELEQEKSKSKQLHYDKVREVKSTKEREQTIARGQQEELKLKLEKDKDQELKSLHDSLSKEYRQQLRAAQKKHEEQMSTAETKWKKENSELRSKVKIELKEQIEREVKSKHAMEQKKITRELFELNSQLKVEEDRVARLTAANKNKEDMTRQKEDEHRVELEKIGRSSRKTSKQHVEEMDGFRRQMQNKEKEISQIAEKLTRTMADKDKIEEELKRLKKAESWVRRSTTPTSPSLSPSTSVEELTAVAKQVTKRERDMVIRNSELSFRVRTLEDGIGELRKDNAEMKKKLSESRSQLGPIKDHNNKLNLRISDLNSSLRSRESKVSSLSQEIVELKTGKQHLEEEYTRQRKSLQQQLVKGSSYRTELQRSSEKNKTVVDTNARLLAKVDKLETEKSQLEDRLRNFTLTSPTPLSPSPFSPTPYQDDDACSLSSSSSSVQFFEQMSQMEFDKEESDARLQEITEKYKEMKSEYSSIRGKYKSIRSKYEETQLKLQDLQTSYKEELSRSEILEKERLQLEKELNLVRRATHNTSPYDQDRQAVMVVSLQHKLDEYQEEIDKLQQFIVEQDVIWVRQENMWEAEKKLLDSKLEQLQHESQGKVTERDDSRMSGSSLATSPEGSSPNLTEEPDTTTDEIAALQEANDNLVEELNTATDEITALQEANDNLVEELNTATDEITALQEANDNLVEELNAATGEVTALQEANDKIVEELNTATGEITALQQAKDNLVEELNTVTGDLSALKESSEKLLGELTTASNKVATLHEANTKLSESLAEETDHVSNLREEKAQLREDLDRARNLLQDREEECSVLSDKVAHLEAEAGTGEVNTLDQRNEEYEQAHPKPPASLPPPEDSSSSLSLDSKEYSESLRPTSTAQQLTELAGQYKEELQQKDEENNELRESLSLAQANITQMRGLLETLQETLRAQTQDHQTLFTDKDEQIRHLSDQLSQAGSKLTRLRRAVPVGVNQQMAQEIGHKVNDAIKKLSSLVQSPSSSSSQVLSELISLEAAVNELLHTLFPGSFDSVVSVDPNLNSEPNATSEPSLNSESDMLEKYTHDDLLDNSSDSSHSSSPGVLPPHHSPPHALTPPHSPSPPATVSQHTSTPLEDIDYSEHAQIVPTPLTHTKEDPSHILTPAWGDDFNLSSIAPAPFVLPSHRRAPRDVFKQPMQLEELLVHSKRKPTESSSVPQSSGTKAEGGFLDRQMRVFVAVMDYDPRSLCVTGKPDDELHFSTGAVLAVKGGMDNEGYYMASFEGKTGRVPANFIQEVDVADPVMKNRLFNQTLSRPLTPDSYTMSSRHILLTTTPTSSSLMQSFVRGQPKIQGGKGCPKPPTQFQVEKALGNSVLLVAWQPPVMDATDGSYSNGCLVTGYQLYVNGDTKTLVSGSTQNRATLVGLNLSQPITLGISTSGAEGKSSKVISLHQPARPMSAVSSPSPEPEVYRMFIALYDYDPAKSSPCEHPEFELAFNEGDLIKVFGQEMDDGLIAGELNGQRGLVPASFISEVRRPNVKLQPTAKKQTADSAQSPAPGDSKLPVTAKLMVASFNYDPERDSPNPNPELELSFKRGDEVSVFGKMHGDGYYSGKLKDRFGLVPSNFLKEPPSTSPIHKSHDSEATPTKQPTVKLRTKVATSDKVQRSNGMTQSETRPVEQIGMKAKNRHTSLTSERVTKESMSPVETGSQTKRKRRGFHWSKSSPNTHKTPPTIK